MHWTALIALAVTVPDAHALLRFSCSQLVVERLDPLVNPGLAPSPHLHQIVGGNAFNITMDPLTAPPNLATCTTCTFADDFSNYWTAVLYFRARNGSYHRVPQKPNVGFEQAKGGMTVYYTPFLTRSTGTSTTSPGGSSAVTAFKPGFRMLIGQQSARTRAEASRFRQLTYTCLQNSMTRTGETLDMPTRPCPAGIMSNVRFPTCWDGANLDSPDHASHVAYPASGTFESGGPCPATHPVRIPQLFYEVVWDTTAFNAKELWPADGGQPFVWSQGDRTGFGNHGDYVFGWKGDALQVAMDSNCDRCPQLKSQGLDKGNQCARQAAVREEVDGWLDSIPGLMPGMEETM